MAFHGATLTLLPRTALDHVEHDAHPTIDERERAREPDTFQTRSLQTKRPEKMAVTLRVLTGALTLHS